MPESSLQTSAAGFFSGGRCLQAVLLRDADETEIKDDVHNVGQFLVFQSARKLAETVKHVGIFTGVVQPFGRDVGEKAQNRKSAYARLQ